MKTNLTINEVVSKAISEIDFESLIRNKIIEQTEKTVKEVIESQFQWSGPIRKQIENEFKRIETIDLHQLGVNQVGALMSDAIVDATNEMLVSQTKEAVQKHMFKGLSEVARINDVNRIVNEIANSLSEREDSSDDEICGDIAIKYIEENSRYGDWKNCFWMISIEDATNVDDEYVKCSVSSRNIGRVYHIEGSRNIDKLNPLVEELQKISLLGLEVRIKEADSSFNNSCD